MKDVRFEEKIDHRGKSRTVKLVFVVDQRKTHRCPCGRTDHRVLHGEASDRRYRDCSLGGFETYVVVRPMRLECGECTRVEELPWVAKGHRMTLRFFEMLAALCTRMAVNEVAELASLAWSTVAAVDATAIELALGGRTPEIRKLRWLGVDEVSRTGGNVFFTVVTDLETGRVVHLGDGKRMQALEEFFKKLGPRACGAVQGVISDLAGSYLKVIGKYVPQAKHALDRFHIVQWVNRALSDIRRRIFGAAPQGGLGRELKLKQWLLVMGRERLGPENDALLERLEQMNHPLYQAYLVKEQLRGLLATPWQSMDDLRATLRTWCSAARKAAPEFEPVAERLTLHEDKVVDGFHPSMRFGIAEAINGKIAQLRRQARGYRNVEYFKLKIFQACSLEFNPWATVTL